MESIYRWNGAPCSLCSGRPAVARPPCCGCFAVSNGQTAAPWRSTACAWPGLVFMCRPKRAGLAMYRRKARCSRTFPSPITLSSVCRVSNGGRGIGWTNCSRSSVCLPRTATGRRRRYPADSSNASRWRAHLRRRHRLSCSTNRFLPSMPRCGSKPAKPWRTRLLPPVRPQCSSRTIRLRRCRSGTKSRCCGAAGWCRRIHRKRCIGGRCRGSWRVLSATR